MLGVNGQLLMHFAALLGMPWADYIEAMREGVRRHGPVRAGIYAMTTSEDEKVAGRMSLVFAGVCSHAPGITGRAHLRRAGAADAFHAQFRGMRRAMRAAQPDALIVIAAEHFANFFMNNMPAYAIGMADHYEGPIEDPAWLGIERDRVPGNAALSQRLIARGDADGRRGLRRGMEVRPRHHGAAAFPDAAATTCRSSRSTSTARARR